MNQKNKDEQRIDNLLKKIDGEVEAANIVMKLTEDKNKNTQNVNFNKINSSNMKMFKKIKNDFWKLESLVDGTILLKEKITIKNLAISEIKWNKKTKTLTYNFLDPIIDAKFFASYYFWKNYFYFPFFNFIRKKVLNWDDFIFSLIKRFGIKSGIITKEETFSEDSFEKIEFYVGESRNPTELLANILSIGAIGILHENEEVIDKIATQILNKILILNK